MFIFLFLQLKRQFKSKKQVGKDVDHLLNKLGLTPKKNCLQSTLSGGQKRRACLAMALISDASVSIKNVQHFQAHIRPNF